MVKGISSYQETSTQFIAEDQSEIEKTAYMKKFESQNSGWGRLWSYYKPASMTVLMLFFALLNSVGMLTYGAFMGFFMVLFVEYEGSNIVAA